METKDNYKTINAPHLYNVLLFKSLIVGVYCLSAWVTTLVILLKAFKNIGV